MLKLRKVLSGLAAITMLCGSMAFISATTLENADEQAAVAETEQKSSKIHDEVYAEINAGKSTVDVMIKYQKPDSAKIKEANEISKSEAKEYAATLDTEKYSEKEILKMEEDYMAKRVNELVGVLYDEQRAKIFKEIGVDMNSEELNLHYLENGKLYDLMFCTLTTAQIEKASNSELVKRISLESSFMNQPERQGTTVLPEVNSKVHNEVSAEINAGKSTIDVMIKYQKPESAKIKEANEISKSEAKEYVATLDTDKYSEKELLNMEEDYMVKRVNELVGVLYDEQRSKIFEEIGVDKNSEELNLHYLENGELYDLMFCTLTPAQIEKASNSELVERISLESSFINQPERETSTVNPVETTFDSQLLLSGDANGDHKVTLADALAILQFIANENKYPLTESLKQNADCYNTGDGITAMDAVVVQKYDTGAIDSLPYLEK